MTIRPRRLRRTPALRALMQSVRVDVSDLVYPIFIDANLSAKKPIASMPGQYQWSLNDLSDVIQQVHEAGVGAVLLFGIPTHKDATGSAACKADGVVQQATRQIKQQVPDLVVIADLCFCEYTDHGHCGPISEQQGVWQVDNDATCDLLAAQAVSLAKAGVDVIAPSGMMDGMVAAIRAGLDAAGCADSPIMSYAVKYASGFYGPFREAAGGSAPQGFDRKGYQMDFARHDECLLEADLDVSEGADMIMVKPAMAYLDIIARVKSAHPEVPMAAYQVSGEYSMIKAAAQAGLLDERSVAHETLTAIKRAGADLIITYFALDVGSW